MISRLSRTFGIVPRHPGASVVDDAEGSSRITLPFDLRLDFIGNVLGLCAYDDLQINPQNATIYKNRGLCYRALNDTAKADADLKAKG